MRIFFTAHISFGFDTESVVAVTFTSHHERLGTKVSVSRGWNTRTLRLYFE
jgi:hypothetical protein